MVIIVVGVFIFVVVLIVVLIVLFVGKSMGISKLLLLIVLLGGGKVGNIILFNLNIIVVVNGFDLFLSDVMIVGFILVVFGLIIVVVFVNIMRNKGLMVKEIDFVEE